MNKNSCRKSINTRESVVATNINQLKRLQVLYYYHIMLHKDFPGVCWDTDLTLNEFKILKSNKLYFNNKRYSNIRTSFRFE